MKTYHRGFGTFQYLLVLATLAAASLLALPGNEEDLNRGQRIIVADAMSIAGESKRAISDAFVAGESLPSSVDEAAALESAAGPMPSFVQTFKIEPGYAGQTVMIKVYLNPGLVGNPEGGEQFVSYVGMLTHSGGRSLKWLCGEKNVGRSLLPEHCHS